jgi:SAM-dependent methyltransferase
VIRGRIARLWGYVAASSRSLEDLKRGMRRRWQGFFDGDADILSGLMPWEVALFDRFIASGGDVLLVGSGSGRDLIALAERGCRVTGVEPAGDALRTARRVLADRRLKATLIEGFFEDTAVAGTFDAVMFSFHAYAYVPESRRRVDVLKKAAALLKTGGHVVVTHPAHMKRPHGIYIRLGRMAGAIAGTDWRVEPGDLIAVGVEHPSAINFVHAFADGDVEREAAAAGLQVVFRAAFDADEVIAVALQ